MVPAGPSFKIPSPVRRDCGNDDFDIRLRRRESCRAGPGWHEHSPTCDVNVHRDGAGRSVVEDGWRRGNDLCVERDRRRRLRVGGGDIE